MFISAVPGSELAVWTHVTPSSWASLPLHSLPIPLGRPRAPSWAHCAMQQLPACYFTQDSIYIYTHTNQYYSLGLPWWLSGKIGACNAGDMGLIPGSGRFPGGGHSNPLWYSCLENPMGRKNLAVTAHGVTKSRTRMKWLSTHICYSLNLSHSLLHFTHVHKSFLFGANTSKVPRMSLSA